MRALIRRAAALFLAAALAACGDDPDAKIAADHQAQARNSQAYAREMFDGLCARRGLSEPRCTCLRTRVLTLGARATAFIGASYGGDLEAAAATAGELDETARTQAIETYFSADAACEAEERRIGGSMPADGAPAPASATLEDVRASCRPAMADVCACRAEALERAIGDGALAAAVAMNSGDEAALRGVAQGREDGWMDQAIAAYARTSAPCIVLAGR